MKVLITGAAGFIGSQLAHRLWKDGEELILVDNFSYGKEDNHTIDTGGIYRHCCTADTSFRRKRALSDNVRRSFPRCILYGNRLCYLTYEW